MNGASDRDVLAGEYVLGTLAPDERARAQALLEAEPTFAEQVHGWERRLDDLNVMVDAVEPPSELWEQVRARIGSVPPPAGVPLAPAGNKFGRSAGAGPGEDGSAEILRLSRRTNRWRALAQGLTALVLLLAALLALAEFAPGLLPDALRPAGIEVPIAQAPQPAMPTTPAVPPASGRYVAVLEKDASAPGFLLTIDPDRRSLVIRRVAAEQEPGKSYELWLVSDKLSAPRSLGVIETGDFTRQQTLEAYDPETIGAATYAVSLEPEGGSPAGVPTGPVLYLGKLIEASPAAAPGATP